MKDNDLSQHHRLITDIFNWPTDKAGWEKYRLTDEQLLFYKKNGYLSGIKLLEDWQVDLLNEELALISDPGHPGNSLFYEFHSNESADSNRVLFHALGAWRIAEGFHDILWNPAFVMAAKQLMGEAGVRFWHDQLFCKPAKHGGVVAWHQDYSYWTRTKPMQHLTCWIGLDDATTENGCLQYVPKSHAWGFFDRTNLAGEMDELLKYLSEEQKARFKPVPIELKRGYATFHHPLLIHGSYENKSDKSRRAVVLNVFADGTLSDTDEELLSTLPVIPRGEKMEGQFFPLLLNGV